MKAVGAAQREREKDTWRCETVEGLERLYNWLSTAAKRERCGLLA